MSSILDLIGKTLVRVEVNEAKDEIEFEDVEGTIWEMYHDQDCCESVTISDVVGDWADLLNTPITMAAEESNSGDKEGGYESFTWTFYKLATVKGFVDLKWYGTSNGYYSESVSFRNRTDGEYRYN